MISKNFDIFTLDKIIRYCKEEKEEWMKVRNYHEEERKRYKNEGKQKEAEEEKNTRDQANKNYKAWEEQEKLQISLYELITGRTRNE